ncbi:MAG: hypothetical protein FJW40_00135 [Acidobacteria bacterium]|nr:hypothetical protein [Acidobacteriota bacterium]
MNKWKNTFWFASGALALAALLGTLAPVAVAQIKAALVRDMDSPVRGTRFGAVIPLSFIAGQFSRTESLTPAIPVGKKLFIQSVSSQVQFTDGQSHRNVVFSISGTDIRFYLDHSFQGSSPGGQRTFVSNVPVNVLISSGESLSYQILRTDDLGAGGVNFANLSIVGYFVDAGL